IVLQQNGVRVNHKRVYRVYREAGLMIRRKRRKRLLRAGFVRPAVNGANQEWALDFVHDAAESGREVRVLSVLDVHTRDSLASEDRRVEEGIQRGTAAQRTGVCGAARVRPTHGGAPVAYGSLRAAMRPCFGLRS